MSRIVIALRVLSAVASAAADALEKTSAVASDAVGSPDTARLRGNGASPEREGGSTPPDGTDLGAAGTAHLRQDSTGEGLHHDGADRPDATLVRVEGAPPDATGVELDDEPELDPKVRTLIGLLWVARGAPVISDRATPAALQTLLGIKLRRGQLPGRS